MRDQASGLRGLQVALPEIHPTSAHVLTVVSGKGGVGKTTLAVNLSLALGSMGSSVLLWDADASLANANVLLNLEPSRTIDDVLRGSATVREVLSPLDRNVWLLPGASGVPELASLSGQSFAALCARVVAPGTAYEVIVADAASGIGSDVLQACQASDQVILVTTTEPTAITDAYGLLKALVQRDFVGRIGVVVNMIHGDSDCEVGRRLCATACRFLRVDAEMLGGVPHSTWVPEAVRQRVPLLRLAPSSAPSEAIRRLAATVVPGRPAVGADPAQACDPLASEVGYDVGRLAA